MREIRKKWQIVSDWWPDLLGLIAHKVNLGKPIDPMVSLEAFSITLERLKAAKNSELANYLEMAWVNLPDPWLYTRFEGF